MNSVDLESISGPGREIYVFNNGIWNNLENALGFGSEQHTAEANTVGVNTIHNKQTGGFLSDVVYAGIDKLREVTGMTRLFGISTASQANVNLQQRVAERNRNLVPGEKPFKIIEVNHSRGSLTSGVAQAWHLNNGSRDVPLARVDFNGAAANAQRAANRVDIITSGQGVVTQATHRMDFLVPRLIERNSATGGAWGFKRGAHTTYGPNVWRWEGEEKVWRVWGVWDGSERGREVLAPKQRQ